MALQSVCHIQPKSLFCLNRGMCGSLFGQVVDPQFPLVNDNFLTFLFSFRIERGNSHWMKIII